MKIITYGAIITPQLGLLGVGFSDHGLVHVSFLDSPDQFTQELLLTLKPEADLEDKRIASLLRQIQDYLAGERREFEVTIDWSGMTEFQREVLQATYNIPYGETRSYGEIAAQIGRASAARAVGRAEATNPLPLVIPCHRVVGADGKLHGYSGAKGLETKAWLLELERGVAANGLAPPK